MLELLRCSTHQSIQPTAHPTELRTRQPPIMLTCLNLVLLRRWSLYASLWLRLALPPCLLLSLSP
eukprot:scaffold270756_cov39-Tisochrysis_lutea.AAC.2